MAISDQYKIDLSYKKLGYGTPSTSTTRAGYEESISSPVPTYDKDIWAEASLIPVVAEEVVGIVEKVTLHSLTQDSGSSIAFLNTLSDFIPPTFGASYVIEVYDNLGTRIFPANIDFFFDYISGTLIFPSGFSGYTLPLKITGYRYVGTKGMVGGGETFPDKEGNAGKVPVVNSTEDGFEYKSVSLSGGNKDIVFMVGDDLLIGAQEHTEFRIPYNGNIEKITVTVGLNSTPSSNLIFAIQKFYEGGWVNINVIELGIAERFKEVVTLLPIIQDRIRINLVSGDFINVSNMSVVLNMKVI